MLSRYEIDEHNRIEDAKKQGHTIAHTGTLYGVRQETLAAYLKAERAKERRKVWEEAAVDLSHGLPAIWKKALIDRCLFKAEQAEKETP